jgi:[acyl-carrier-protein] S-malonyltransferase
MAGHSLGEYSAIYAAGSLSLGMAAKLVSDRGNIMASYSGSEYNDPDQKLGMAAVLGLPYEKLREIVTKGCVIANDNSDSQVVISGLQSEIEIVSNRAIAIGAKKIIKLNTAGAFHSPFMVEANRKFIEETLSKISLSNPSIQIIMNATAAPVSDAVGMYKSLALQMVSPVMWRSTIDCMAKSGIGSIIEIGAGKVLTDISKRSHPDIKMLCLGTIADIEEFVKDEQQQ